MEIKDWIDAGYKRFELTDRLLNKNADFGLQKSFRDEQGKKFYITVYVYDRDKYPNKYKVDRYGFMPTANFDLRDNQPFFNVDMNGTFTIEECEAWFERMFEFFGRPYYALYENATI